jgi:DNA-directed RNA polymerase subunit RPC12/RpoP
MQTKRFAKNDSGFTCLRCGLRVEPLGRTSRNHCPRCLYSLHVDVMPGDRASDCRGLMEPIAVVPDSKGYRIKHRCTSCGHTRMNRAALSGTQPDDMASIIDVSASAQQRSPR